jgi:hypothetical protein
MLAIPFYIYIKWRGTAWAVGVLSFLGSGLVFAQQPCASAPQAQAENRSSAPTKKPQLGPLEISIHWRPRVEGWDWFRGREGQSNYALGHSWLRIAVGQTCPHFNRQVEAAQATILGPPSNAIVPAPQGRLGLGGTYCAADGSKSNNPDGFVKQALVQLTRR